MNSKILVSGNIIGELSDKIPSNIIALNELIKNSYDAGAKKVIISLDSFNKILTIKDNGCGMEINDIDTLFHISTSKKRYGELNEYGRYTQGSKGLGFLSVFKFGKFVEWKTKKNKGLKFFIDYLDLTSSNDISKYEIAIEEDNSIDYGTEIKISLDDYNTKSIMSYLNQEENYKKVINAFDDSSFEIELLLNQNKYSSKKTSKFAENLPDRQLYYVRYNSKDQIIEFYHNNHLAITQNFTFNSNSYSLDIELMIFHLYSGAKAKIDPLFINPDGDLTPLVYVNSNLFNNFDIFNPNMMRNIKSGKTLNQMIGYIRIISNNPMISFNSDRSQFLQNELTDSIKEFLSKINKNIQEIGSDNKTGLFELNIFKIPYLPEESKNASIDELRTYIIDEFTFKNRVEIIRVEDRVIYSVFGREKSLSIRLDRKDRRSDGSGSNNRGSNDKTNQNKGMKPAKIKLKSKEVRLEIPSSQLNLLDEIEYIYDSKGNPVELDKVEIRIDGKPLTTNIIPSIRISCRKNVEYVYLDSNTGEAVEMLSLVFVQPMANFDLTQNNIDLIVIPSNKSYSICFNPFLNRLIDQINGLNRELHMEVIACSLRAIFDISIDEIRKSTKFDAVFSSLTGKGDKLANSVIGVIQYIQGNKNYQTIICTNSRINYDSFVNMLDVEAYRAAIGKAHLGAHKSTSHISSNDIENLGKLAGLFIVIANEMVTNTNIN